MEDNQLVAKVDFEDEVDRDELVVEVILADADLIFEGAAEYELIDD